MPKANRKDRMDEDELRAIIDHEERNALGRHDGELSEHRRQAMHAYYGESIGNEVAGRSRIVTRDVLEVVEWAMPELLDVFASNDIVARFTPTGKNDTEEARQATNYVNHVFFNHNDGFEIFHDMFKDALLQKTGTVKTWWDDTPEVKREEYSGLDDFAFQKLVSDEDVEVLAHSETPITDAETNVALGLPPDMPLMVHDVEIERIVQDGRVRVEVIPPEEILVSKRARSLDSADFKAHRIHISVSDLKQMFPDFDQSKLEDIPQDDEQEWDEEYIARHNFDDSYGGDDSYNYNWLGRKVWMSEVYINVDWDGDGYAELRKITKVGSIILENIEVDDHPFSAITPIKIPHKYFGMSLADITVDLQVTKSALLRNLLDNMYNLNHGRFEAVDGQVNMDDLLTSRPGGVVRVKTAGALKRLDTPTIPNGGYDMMDYVDRLRDGRTGVSKFRTGLDTDFLNNAKAGPVDNQMEAANARLRLYARRFKETGVKQMFEKIYRLIVRHQDRPDIIQVTGEWVPIDPTQWEGNCNCNVQTGLGHGERAKKMQEMVMLGQQYAALRQDPEMAPMVTRENIYNVFQEGLRAMDYKNVGDFITDPKTLPDYQPQPDPKAQADLMRAQNEKLKLQLEQQKMQAQMGEGQQKLQLEQEKQMLEVQRDNVKSQIEVMKLQAELAAERDQNVIEQDKSRIEVMKLEQEMLKLEAEMAQKEAEMILKEKELEVEKQQDRPVKVGD